MVGWVGGWVGGWLWLRVCGGSRYLVTRTQLIFLSRYLATSSNNNFQKPLKGN